MLYVGMFFAGGGKVTKSQRNVSVLMQLCVVFLGVVNAKEHERKSVPREFEARLGTRIYYAFCALFHHCLPLLIQISLCTSTLFNPSIFGWFSFCVMVIVNYKPDLLDGPRQRAGLITFLFNICFIAQYLLYLGYPTAFVGSFWNVMDGVRERSSPERSDFVLAWLRFLGIYDVSMIALLSNCISAFIFTLYTEWHNTFVDYDMRFTALPQLIRGGLCWFTTYIFEFMMVLNMIVNSMIDTIDGALFFILTAALFVVSLFHEYPKERTLEVMSLCTFAVIALREVSLLPVLVDAGVGHWAREAFDLPYRTTSNYESLWIIVYTIERLAIHVMQSKLYHECQDTHFRHASYRWLRTRQLRLLRGVDAKLLPLLAPTVDGIPAMLTREMRRPEHPVDPGGLLPRLREWVVLPLVDGFLRTLAGTLNLNQEAGLNVLTLQSVFRVLKKLHWSGERGERIEAEAKERAFLQRLPPSFALQLPSVAEIGGPPVISGRRGALLIRYGLLLLRRLAPVVLTLISFIYICVKPHLGALILSLFVLSVVLSLDIRGAPRAPESLLIFSSVVLALRHVCRMDIIRDKIADTPSAAWDWFGMNPNDGPEVEMLVFAATVLYVVDRLALVEVFPPSWYHETFNSRIPDFVTVQLSGIVNNPDKALGVSAPAQPLLEQIAGTFHRPGLAQSAHRTYGLVLDCISFLWLLIFWSTWAAADAPSYAFALDAVLVLILWVHALFALIVVFAHVASNFHLLFVTNIVWFIYTYVISFFALPNRTGTLYVYFILRFIDALVIAHACFTARRLIGVPCPHFGLEYISVIIRNKFIRLVPFVFEIQTAFMWLARRTLIPLADFFVLRDVQLQLEVHIARQANPKSGDAPSLINTRAISAVLLLACAAVIIGPLFALSEGSAEKVVDNPPTAVGLEIGFGSLPPLYQAAGVVHPAMTGDLQEISDSGLSEWRFIVLNDASMLVTVSFPLFSFQNWRPAGSMVAFLEDMLGPASAREIVPYYRLTFHFEYPTGLAGATDYSWQRQLTALDAAGRAALLRDVMRRDYSAVTALPAIELPVGLTVPSVGAIDELPNVHRSLLLVPSNTTEDVEWHISLGSSAGTPLEMLMFINKTDSLTLLVWSERANPNTWSGTQSSYSATILVLYIVIVLCISLVVRDFTSGQGDSLWIDRVEAPERLYEQLLSINAHGAAGDTEKEAQLAQEFLATVRSREKFLSLTAKSVE
jgi:hypothetical protein